MNSQLYTAASGLQVEQRRLELIANNLANLRTDGFRAQRLFTSVYQRFAKDAAQTARAGNAAVAVAGAYTTAERGPHRQTGRNLDIALESEAYLAVQTSSGVRYTRAGSLQVSPPGELTDGSGQPVLDSKGKPIGGLGPGASIGSDGRVLDGEAELGRLRVVRDPEGVLKREGYGLASARGKDAALETDPDPEVRPGWIEESSTDAVGELVRLIEAQRAFESYQKLISMTMNEVNRRAVNDLAG